MIHLRPTLAVAIVFAGNSRITVLQRGQIGRDRFGILRGRLAVQHRRHLRCGPFRLRIQNPLGHPSRIATRSDAAEAGSIHLQIRNRTFDRVAFRAAAFQEQFTTVQQFTRLPDARIVRITSQLTAMNRLPQETVFRPKQTHERSSLFRAFQ